MQSSSEARLPFEAPIFEMEARLAEMEAQYAKNREVADAAAVAEDIRYAIAEAEQMADVEIRSVYLGVTGGHIRGFNNRGFHPVVSHDREIMEEDVQDVIKNAKAINIPADHHTIHVVRQHFIVEQRREAVDACAEAELEDRTEILPQRRAVMLARHIDETGDKALERRQKN